MLTPITPAPTGNGLAMRAHALASAAGSVHDVHLFVLPVAGRIPGTWPGPPGVVARHQLPATTNDDREEALAWLSDPWWRDRLSALAPLPPPTSLASPFRAAEVTALLGDVPVRAVLAFRLSTALLGTSLSRQLGVPLIIDADDDDVGLLTRLGRTDEAAAWARVGRLVFGSATLVTVAGEPDQIAVRERYGFAAGVALVPNSVVIPPPASLRAPPSRGRILFLGNLGYGPNVGAARWLVEQVLPLLDDHWSVELVGPAHTDVEKLAGRRVVVRGRVVDVAEAYARSDVAVAPLRAASGTRIKVLEAMAHRRPVVTTTAGAAGIDGVPGRDFLLADQPEEFARHIAGLGDPEVSERLVVAAAALVARLYDATSIIESAGRLLREVTRPGPGPEDGAAAGRS
jgi:glycosyltransferase involved in cell wall biosynthesis